MMHINGRSDFPSRRRSETLSVWSYCEVLRAFITNVKQMRRGEKDGVQGGWRGKCRAGQSYKKKIQVRKTRAATRSHRAWKPAGGFRKSEGSRCAPGRCWLDANESGPSRRSFGGADNLLSTTRPSEELYKGFLWSSGTSPKITLGQSWSDGPWLRANTLQQRHTLKRLLSLLLLSQSPKTNYADNRRTYRAKVWTHRKTVLDFICNILEEKHVKTGAF